MSQASSPPPAAHQPQEAGSNTVRGSAQLQIFGQEHQSKVYYLERIQAGPPETPEEIEADEHEFEIHQHLRELLEELSSVSREAPRELDPTNYASYGGYPTPMRVWDRAGAMDV